MRRMRIRCDPMEYTWSKVLHRFRMGRSLKWVAYIHRFHPIWQLINWPALGDLRDGTAFRQQWFTLHGFRDECHHHCQKHRSTTSKRRHPLLLWRWNERLQSGGQKGRDCKWWSQYRRSRINDNFLIKYIQYQLTFIFDGAQSLFRKIMTYLIQPNIVGKVLDVHFEYQPESDHDRGKTSVG